MKRAEPVLVRLVTSILMGLVIATALFLLTFILHIPLTPDSVRFAIQDHAQRVSNQLSPAQDPPKYRIRLVSVPAHAEGGIGKVLRTDLARVVKKLDEAKAAVIVLDADLTGPSPGDASLSRSLAALRHATAIVPLQLSRRPSGACDNRTSLALASPASANEVTWPASYDIATWKRVLFVSAEVEDDLDGVSRSICPFTTAWWTPSPATPPKKIIIPTLPVVAAFLSNPGALPKHWTAALATSGVLQGLPDPARHGLEKEDFEARRLHLVAAEKQPVDDPIIVPGILRFPHEVLDGGPADLSDLTGTVVIVGSTDPATGDRKATPLGNMSGLLLSANAIAAISTGDYLASEESHGFASYSAEMLFVLAGCALFFLLNDAVPMWLTPRLYWGERATHSWLAVPLGIAWFLVVTLAVGALLLITAVFVAAWGVTRGVAPDPALTMLSITAERVIHAGVALEERLHHLVAAIVRRWRTWRAARPSIVEVVQGVGEEQQK